MYCAGLYQAFNDEGRALNSAEAAEVDEDLPSDCDDSAAEDNDPNGDPLRALQRSKTGLALEVDEERILSNKARLQATFMVMLETPSGIKYV